MPRYDDLISALGKQTIFCSNLGFGEQGAILSKFKSAVYICPDIISAKNMQAQLSALGKKNVLLDDFNKPFTLYKYTDSNFVLDVIKALESLVFNDAIIVSTPQIINTPLPTCEEFKNNTILIEKNSEQNIDELTNKLIDVGYKKVDAVTNKGEFSVRGDIVDIFNTVDSNPTRLDFFDTIVEDIYTYDFLSFEKLNKLSKIHICPNVLVFHDKNNKLKTLLEKHMSNNLVAEIVASLERGEDVANEFYTPLGYTTICDYNLPIVVSNSLQFETMLNEDYENVVKKSELVFKEKQLINCYINEKTFVNCDNFYKKYAKNLVFFENFDVSTTDLRNKFNALNFDFACKKFDDYLYNLSNLYQDMKPYLDKQIFLCLGNASTLKAIKKIFDDTHTPYTLNKNAAGLILTELNIPHNICFLDSDKFYIGSTNFAHQKQAMAKVKQTVKYLPKAGEYVVHNVHGIGRCEGVVSLDVEGASKEFFKIEYRGGIVYVPTENADSLSLYMADGGTVTLNKLGGKEFLNQKLKAIKSIEDLSHELITLYAKRKAAKGFKYSEDDYLYTQFETAFAYPETADQLQAIADVKRDMTSGKVMDRLICGDVGFGKTEVAMRALFKAVEDGKQVAILAPTTILSLQHYMTASARTENFGVRVAMLNRFKTAKEQKEIVLGLKNHTIDVVCGTHRLLSKDVNFADLGLLILDEEQRFGVKAKEHIKQLKNSVDVLTLSATPIPRTLSMALMTIRDISIINTPPVNRLPIKTYVINFNLEVVASAINDELSRGGQVLVVYNDISKIYALKDRLAKAVSNKNAVFDVAHGQMGEIELENAIKRLYDGQTNVLVSTTLIENGIDLPKANTLIVVDSDRLGLSQMYQLRGRVGRSDKQAYAYFTYDKEKLLSEDAANRLQAIAENTELGSGFKIAMRDLQIRGAGELLGKVQHGNMVKIGYEMYTKLLNDTIKRLNGENVEVEREVKIDISLSSRIPYDFVSEESERLKIISRISSITDKQSARDILNELIVTYGKLPKEIYQLANVAIIRAQAAKQKIKTITLKKTIKPLFITKMPMCLNSLKRWITLKTLNLCLPGCRPL